MTLLGGGLDLLMGESHLISFWSAVYVIKQHLNLLLKAVLYETNFQQFNYICNAEDPNKKLQVTSEISNIGNSFCNLQCNSF